MPKNVLKRVLYQVCSVIILLFIYKTELVIAAVSTWQQSASFYPTSSTDFISQNFKQALTDFAGIGGNYVTFIIPYYQSNLSSSSIHAGWNTPSDSTITEAINYAHSLGLKVMLKPHLDVETGEWRALINPSDRNAWFSSYGAMVTKYATIAKNTGASGLTVGAELSNMTNSSNTANTTGWNNLITQIRTIYNGQLTYSAQRSGYQGEVNNIGFWNNLDAIGISAYYELAANEANPSVNSLVSSWDYWNQTEILPIYQQYQKPILFTEIGYRSVDGAHAKPWDYNLGGGANQAEQDKLYQALFTYWNNQSHMIGVHLWDFSTNPNAGGVGDTSYTPQNKLTEETIKTWFSTAPGPTPSPSPSPTPVSNANYQITATYTPAAPKPNQSVTVNENVKSTANLSNTIVDIEVYNQFNAKVHQQFFENQNFVANVSKLFQTVWTPVTTGIYTIKTGIFTQNWSQLLHWNDQVTSINVNPTPTPNPTTSPSPHPTSSPTPSPTPTPTTTPTPTPTSIPSPTPSPTTTPSPSPTPTTTPQIEVWWPTNNASISGLQPFKAIIKDMILANYKLYWQVDGGALNEMHDSQQDYPHKEALVDVSGWKWRGNGPYTLSFIAKSNSGNIITQKSITIFIY